MRIHTFVIGCALAVSLFLFAQHHPQASSSTFRSVVDLTHPLNAATPTFDPAEKQDFKINTDATIEKNQYFARTISLPEHFGTHLDAPAHFVAGLWTVDQIPAERLLAPLVVLDLTLAAQSNPDYRVSVEDVAQWEKSHGQIPLGSVVMVRTGWEARWESTERYRNPDSKGVLHFPGYSEDAAKFLVDARNVLGLGIDTLSIDYGPSTDFPAHHYVLSHSVYQLENVANLDRVPATGAEVVVAPMKLEGGSGSPVRILAFLQ